jgi:hypothetical protein
MHIEDYIQLSTEEKYFTRFLSVIFYNILIALNSIVIWPSLLRSFLIFLFKEYCGFADPEVD